MGCSLPARLEITLNFSHFVPQKECILSNTFVTFPKLKGSNGFFFKHVAGVCQQMPHGCGPISCQKKNKQKKQQQTAEMIDQFYYPHT